MTTPEFAIIQNTPAVAQIQNAMRDERTTFLSYLRKLSLPMAVRFAVAAGILSVAYAMVLEDLQIAN